MEPVVVGIMAAGEQSRALARTVAERLPQTLGERIPGVEWRAEVREVEPAEPSASSHELVDTVRRRLLDEGWELGVGLTELPLRSGKRPVSALASATHGVGLISIPALGVRGVPERATQAAVRLVEGLLGAGRGDGRARLKELGSPLGRARTQDDGTIRFVGATLRGNARLLLGMVRANQPERLVTRLSRTLVGALGTGAYALSSSSIWQLADGLGWPRLLAFSLLAVGGTCTGIVIAHDLWERTSDPGARERVALFNLATAATVVIGVVTLYAALFAGTTAVAALVIPSDLLAKTVGHAVGVSEYLRLGCVAAIVATLGGALGSMIESDLEVRNAAHRFRHET